MKTAVLAALAVATGACGPGIRSKINGVPDMEDSARADAIAELVRLSAAGDAAAIEGALASPLGFGGLWFPDSECNRLFAVSGTIPATGIAPFAKCLAKLRFEPSEREHPYSNVAVLTYAPGIEIEVLFGTVAGKTQVRWIGYTGRREGKDALPTVSQRALEALRVTDATATFDDAVLARIGKERETHLSPEKEHRVVSTWFKVCINVDGQVTGAHAHWTTSLVAAEVFAVAIKQWTFRPFVLGGQRAPVCSMVMMVWPAGVTYPNGPPPPPLPEPVPASHADAIILPATHFGELVAGTRLLVPDPETMTLFNHNKVTQTRASTSFCLDRTGKVDWVLISKSSGFPRYDRVLTTGIAGWKFKPPTFEGRPFDACGTAYFVYHQR